MVLLMDNYRLQADQAKKCFLTYDQEKLVEKFHLKSDGSYLYFSLFGLPYRISRHTGDLEKFRDSWEEGNDFGEVMTALDILCDAREDRFLTGRWKPMQNFGRLFHSKYLEEGRDPLAQAFQNDPEGMKNRCLRMGARPIPNGDLGYAFPVMDGLCAGLFFWYGDEEFPPRIRWFWDENADRYLRYETMFYTVGFLRDELLKDACSDG